MQNTKKTVTDSRTVASEKQYWKDYKGAVIREGDHYETDKGALLFWHSYEAKEAQAFLAGAADEAERAAGDCGVNQ